jgi:hypothetical protein
MNVSVYIESDPLAYELWTHLGGLQGPLPVPSLEPSSPSIDRICLGDFFGPVSEDPGNVDLEKVLDHWECIGCLPDSISEKWLALWMYASLYVVRFKDQHDHPILDRTVQAFKAFYAKDQDVLPYLLIDELTKVFGKDPTGFDAGGEMTESQRIRRSRTRLRQGAVGCLFACLLLFLVAFSCRQQLTAHERFLARVPLGSSVGEVKSIVRKDPDIWESGTVMQWIPAPDQEADEFAPRKEGAALRTDFGVFRQKDLGKLPEWHPDPSFEAEFSGEIGLYVERGSIALGASVRLHFINGRLVKKSWWSLEDFFD